MHREMPFLMILVIVFFGGGVLFAVFGYLVSLFKSGQGYSLFLLDFAKVMLIFAGIALVLRIVQGVLIFFI